MDSGWKQNLPLAAAARACPAVALALLATLQPALAKPLRVCGDDRAHPPFLYTDRDGTAQLLLKMAAERAGVPLELSALPARRCKAELQRRAVDAVMLIAYVESHSKDVAFPMRDGRPDPDKALATVQAKVFRRKGSQAAWDGRRFSALDRPVLVPSGYAFIIDRLVQSQVPYDEGAREADQNFLKLIGSRADLVILPENDGLELLSDPRWADKIEVLPAPFVIQDFYIGFAPAFQRQNPELTATLWRAIGEVRASREYRQAAAQLQHQVKP